MSLNITRTLNRSGHPDRQLSGHMQIASKVIIAVGGGKGGIGKSFFSTNLAYSFAQMGLKTILVDLDLGAANLHTLVGLKIPKATLSDFVNNKVSSLAQIQMPTHNENLTLISGANDDLDIREIDELSILRIKKGLKALSFEVMILDLGAGTSDFNLEIFDMADRSVLLTTPEPTSIENGYRFLKSAFFRKFRKLELNHGLKHTIAQAMNQKSRSGIKNPKDLFEFISKHDLQTGQAVMKAFDRNKIDLVFNQIRDNQDLETGQSMAQICRQYFGFKTEIGGYLDYDNVVWQTLREKTPLVISCPKSHVVTQIRVIAEKFINRKERALAA